MKEICMILLVLATVTCHGQPDEDDWCRNGDTNVQKDQVRDQVYSAILLVNSVKGKISPDTYNQVKLDYRSLQVNFNSIFRKVSNDIADGYLLVGENVICRKYGKSLQRNLIEAKDFKDQLDAIYSKASNVKSNSPGLFIQTLISSFNYIKGIASKAAKNKAKRFYDNSKWIDFDKISNELE